MCYELLDDTATQSFSAGALDGSLRHLVTINKRGCWSTWIDKLVIHEFLSTLSNIMQGFWILSSVHSEKLLVIIDYL